MKRKVKAWVAVDDNGDPMFTSVYKGFYAVLEENVPGKTIPWLALNVLRLMRREG